MQTHIDLVTVLVFGSFVANMALFLLIYQRFAPKKNHVDYFEILAINRRIEMLSESFDNRISNYQTRCESLHGHLKALVDETKRNNG